MTDKPDHKMHRTIQSAEFRRHATAATRLFWMTVWAAAAATAEESAAAPAEEAPAEAAPVAAEPSSAPAEPKLDAQGRAYGLLRCYRASGDNQLM